MSPTLVHQTPWWEGMAPGGKDKDPRLRSYPLQHRGVIASLPPPTPYPVPVPSRSQELCAELQAHLFQVISLFPTPFPSP